MLSCIGNRQYCKTTYLLAVNDEVVVAEREPALLEVVVGRVVVVSHLRYRWRRHLADSTDGQVVQQVSKKKNHPR